MYNYAFCIKAKKELKIPFNWSLTLHKGVLVV